MDVGWCRQAHLFFENGYQTRRWADASLWPILRLAPAAQEETPQLGTADRYMSGNRRSHGGPARGHFVDRCAAKNNARIGHGNPYTGAATLLAEPVLRWMVAGLMKEKRV